MHRGSPAGEDLVAPRAVDLRSEAALLSPPLGDRREISPDADSESGKEGSPETGALNLNRSNQFEIEDIGFIENEIVEEPAGA